MSSTTRTIVDGQTVTQDPSDSIVYHFLWGTKNLNTGVTIATNTTTIRKVTPSAGSSVATVDNVGVLADGRTSQVRVIGGGDTAVGHLYEVTNQIVTDESPAQTKQRSFRIRIQQR